MVKIKYITMLVTYGKTGAAAIVVARVVKRCKNLLGPDVPRFHPCINVSGSPAAGTERGTDGKGDGVEITRF